MKIVLIGTGNVAANLGAQFVHAGHTILQVYGRNTDKAIALANHFNSGWVNHPGKVETRADLYLVAVSDGAIKEMCRQLQLKNNLVVHTAGSVSIEILNNVSTEYGVFYPLQSLHTKTSKNPKIPFLIDASSAQSLQKLQELAASMGADFQISGDDQRFQMHLAAVWVNNFPNLMYAIAYRICQEKGLNFTLLQPLIQETAERLNETDPWIWQTGPAFRNDQNTLELHQLLLQNQPQWRDLYKALSEQIQQISKTYSRS